MGWVYLHCCSAGITGHAVILHHDLHGKKKLNKKTHNLQAETLHATSLRFYIQLIYCILNIRYHHFENRNNLLTKIL